MVGCKGKKKSHHCSLPNKPYDYVYINQLYMVIVQNKTNSFFLMVRQTLLKLLLLSIILYCAFELIIGIKQLLCFKSTICYITGTFSNPGPYGGFLSVCSSLFVAYYVKRYDSSCCRLTTYYNRLVLVIILLTLIVLPSTMSRSAMLALCISLTMLVLGTCRLRIKLMSILRKYGVWIIIALISTGTILYLFKKPSADGRLFMDKICIKTMCANGWAGSGINHFGSAYGKTQAHYFLNQIKEKGKDDLDWTAINKHDRLIADCPENAYNEYLFIGVEAGSIAMLLFIGMMVTVIVISFKRRTIWCYGLTAFAVFAMFSYPLHIRQFQILLPILLAAAIIDGAKEHNRTKIPEFAIISTVLILLTVVAIRTLPDIRQHKQAEAAWKKAKLWHDMEYYEYVVEECDTLVPYMKHNQQFLFAYGQSLNKTGIYEKSDSILKIGTEISSDPMFWNVMGNNSVALGRYREAEERYKHAFYMVPNRLYPLYLLAKLYHTEGDTVSFLDMADRVETFIPKVKSVNTERLRAEIRELKAEYTTGLIKKEND